jgi:hypothetical protein
MKFAEPGSVLACAIYLLKPTKEIFPTAYDPPRLIEITSFRIAHVRVRSIDIDIYIEYYISCEFLNRKLGIRPTDIALQQY